jgi:hypothetical protein
MSKDKNSLTVFRDLTIRGMIDNIASLGDAIQKQLPSNGRGTVPRKSRTRRCSVMPEHFSFLNAALQMICQRQA